MTNDSASKNPRRHEDEEKAGSAGRNEEAPARPLKAQPVQPGELAEGIDYTLEDGYLVFTAHYLLKRGYCCGSGCRNCPYEKADKAGSGGGGAEG